MFICQQSCWLFLYLILLIFPLAANVLGGTVASDGRSFCEPFGAEALGQLGRLFIFLFGLFSLLQQLGVLAKEADDILVMVSTFRERKDCFHRYYRFEVGRLNLDRAREILIQAGDDQSAVQRAYEVSWQGFKERYGAEALGCSWVLGKGEVYHEGERADVPNWVYRFRGGWD